MKQLLFFFFLLLQSCSNSLHVDSLTTNVPLGQMTFRVAGKQYKIPCHALVLKTMNNMPTKLFITGVNTENETISLSVLGNLDSIFLNKHIQF